MTIWRHIWTLWHCHESIKIYSSKNADVSKKTWLDGIKYCYKCKNLFQYFVVRGQYFFCLYLLPRYSNFKMVQFSRDFENFWRENADISKRSAGKAWKISIFGNLRNRVCSVQNLKFLALLVEILIWGIVLTITMNLMHIKGPWILGLKNVC